MIETYLEDLNPIPPPMGRPSLGGGGADSKASSSNDDSSDLRGREEEQ